MYNIFDNNNSLETPFYQNSRNEFAAHNNTRRKTIRRCHSSYDPSTSSHVNKSLFS